MDESGTGCHISLLSRVWALAGWKFFYEFLCKCVDLSEFSWHDVNCSSVVLIALQGGSPGVVTTGATNNKNCDHFTFAIMLSHLYCFEIKLSQFEVSLAQLSKTKNYATNS
jgi:hypothetical protein